MFGQLLAACVTVPFLKRFVRNLSFNEKLRELAALRLALERHDFFPLLRFKRSFVHSAVPEIPSARCRTLRHY
jgi:hypothetical protein